MELIHFGIPKSLKKLIIAPLGDIQWSGQNGPTAKDSLQRHIDMALDMGAFFIGAGDYTDSLSPSNRKKLLAAGLYDTAQEIISEKAIELMEELYEKFLKPTTGRWIGMVEGHHHYETGGWTTDQKLADLLKTQFLGTSAYIKIPSIDYVIWIHHGVGSGMLPGVGLNRLYHIQGTIQGADLYMIGHNTKLAAAPLGRTYPKWGKKKHEHSLSHRNVHLVNTGGFSRSLVPHSRFGTIPRGGYAEQGMYVPSPLRAPFIEIDTELIHQYFNEAVWIKL